MEKNINDIRCAQAHTMPVYNGKMIQVDIFGVDWETVFPEIEFHEYIEWKKPDDYEIEQFIDIVGVEKIKSILEGK